MKNLKLYELKKNYDNQKQYVTDKKLNETLQV